MEQLPVNYISTQTTGQLAESEREITEHLALFAKVMRGEVKECLTCHVAVEHYTQIGPCVYAEPCSHRQWQGKVPPGV